MRGHLSADTIAAFREGLLPSWRAHRVRAHLSACPDCAAIRAQLATVTSALASHPAPPMPDSVTARIEAALAAEVAARQAGTAPEPAPVPVGKVPVGRHDRPGVRQRNRGQLVLRVASAAAAVAVIAGAGYGLSRLPAGGRASSASSGPTNTNRTVPRPGAEPARGTFTAPLSSGTPVKRGTPVISSGTRYQSTTLAAQATAVLAGFGQHRPPANWSASTVPSAPGSQAIKDLPGCIARVSGGHHVVLVDLASYRGRPAAVIYVAAPGHRISVWVTGTGCSTVTPDTLARATVPARG